MPRARNTIRSRSAIDNLRATRYSLVQRDNLIKTPIFLAPRAPLKWFRNRLNSKRISALVSPTPSPGRMYLEMINLRSNKRMVSCTMPFPRDRKTIGRATSSLVLNRTQLIGRCSPKVTLVRTVSGVTMAAEIPTRRSRTWPALSVRRPPPRRCQRHRLMREK